ncbi:MAG: radical SAM protein [Deltaproteobacteria bacterium]|nr:radical SAM protein [Deltaproteobacteria bacterium]MBW2253464.1 radical SAM protein [Deltaproteobacteria bacterium]
MSQIVTLADAVEAPERAPGSLPEFRRYHPRPGHPDWPTLAAEARALAQEVRADLEPPRRGWREARRRAAAMATAVDNYQYNWRLHRRGQDALRPLYFIWTTTRVCNFSCTYCDDHQGRKYPDLPNEGVLDTAGGRKLLRIMRTRASAVYFAGGEPMARPDLPDLTRTARDLHYYPIVVNTNASLVHGKLRQARWRTWLADTDIVVVSLDSLCLETLGAMWAYRRPADVVRNLLLLRDLAKEMRVKLMVNTVIQPGRVADARDVLDLCDDLGIWYCPVPVNVAAGVDRRLADDPEYQGLAHTILERKRAGTRIIGSWRMNRRMLHSEPFECRNTLKPHVDYDGHLVWPCKSTQNVAPAYVQVLDFQHVDDIYDAASRLVNPNGFHGPAKNQCGGSCNWAQHYTTDAYAHGLERPLSLVGEVRGFLERGRAG